FMKCFDLRKKESVSTFSGGWRERLDTHKDILTHTHTHTDTHTHTHTHSHYSFYIPSSPHLFVKPSPHHHRHVGVPLDGLLPLPKAVHLPTVPGDLRQTGKEIKQPIRLLINSSTPS